MTRESVSSDLGFTLIELMVAVGVIALLLSIAVPGFTSLYYDSQRSALVNDLLADMMYARSESSRRGRAVVVCSTSNGTSCGSSSDWGGGWIVFEDTNGNGAKDNTASEAIDRRAAGRAAKMAVTANQAAFSFKPFNQGTVGGAVKICDPRDAGRSPASHSRTIIVSASGRPRVDTVQADGNPLSCS